MKKKLGTLISLGVVALLSIAVIILYLVPVNYTPLVANPNYIVVNKTETTSGTFTNAVNETQYNEIITEFNQSFTRSLLSAIFAGQTTGGLNQSATGELPSTTTIDLTTYVSFRYNEAQTLIINSHEQSLKFTEMIFAVSDSSIYDQVTIYFKQNVTGTSYYKLTTYALQVNFYDYIQDLVL